MISTQSEITTYFLNAFIAGTDNGRITASRLESALKCRSDFELMLMLVYEYPFEYRIALVRRLGLTPPDLEASEALKKSLGQRFVAEDLFTNRDVRLSDSYLLCDFDPTIGNGIHHSLVNA